MDILNFLITRNEFVEQIKQEYTTILSSQPQPLQTQAEPSASYNHKEENFNRKYAEKYAAITIPDHRFDPNEGKTPPIIAALNNYGNLAAMATITITMTLIIIMTMHITMRCIIT